MALVRDIRMIAAMSSNGIIGASGQLPWNIPEVHLVDVFFFELLNLLIGF